MGDKKIRLDIDKVRQFQERGKWTQQDLADMLGISKALMSYHMTRRTKKGAEMLAPIFGVDPTYLVRSEDSGER